MPWKSRRHSEGAAVRAAERTDSDIFAPRRNAIGIKVLSPLICASKRGPAASKLLARCCAGMASRRGPVVAAAKDSRLSRVTVGPRHSVDAEIVGQLQRSLALLKTLAA